MVIEFPCLCFIYFYDIMKIISTTSVCSCVFYSLHTFGINSLHCYPYTHHEVYRTSHILNGCLITSAYIYLFTFRCSRNSQNNLAWPGINFALINGIFLWVRFFSDSHTKPGMVDKM